MKLSIITKVLSFLGFTQSQKTVVQEKSKGDGAVSGSVINFTAIEGSLKEIPVPTPSEFDIAKEKFNLKTDILVISEIKAKNLSKVDKAWLEGLGDRVFYFKDDTLVNTALVRAGYGY